jgi:LCP family protein required for cell wall assembly
MPGEEKPYRVYRAGRARPWRLSLPSRTVSRKPARRPRPVGKGDAEPPRRPRSRRRLLLRGVGALVALFLLWLAAWALAGYFSFREGVAKANERLPRAVRHQLTGGDGLPLTTPTTILLLGTDTGPGRRGIRHSDSIMLVRTDPDHHRVAYLSVPRDLRVAIPGYGTDKVNVAYQVGGPALAVRTIRELTGLRIDHVVLVDFSRFRRLIDAVGGVDVTVPAPIVSDRFDCPLKTPAACARWPGWRFAKGKQHMDGRRALIYTRIRVNRLNPADNDITRAERQQQVVQALAAKLASVQTFLDLPFKGSDLLAPVATDLSAGELLQLGWVYWRADAAKTVHCRLGGQPEGGYIVGEVDRNLAVIAMFKGASALQPPPPGSGTFGPGCVEGRRSLGAR